jgi:predicted ATPase
MQKIIIKNFGPVKNAEIEITPLLVLIGEQATGKSTIAKLIYFFKSLSDEFFRFSLKVPNEDKITTERYYRQLFMHIIRGKFHNFFGSPSRMGDFRVFYQYNEGRYITVSNTDSRISLKFSDNFFGKELFTEFRKAQRALSDFRKEILNEGFSTTNNNIYETVQKTVFRVCKDLVNNMFYNTHDDSLYIVAGRNATIGYSNFYEGMLTANLQKKLEGSIRLKSQTIDETLMLEFLEHVSDIRKQLNKSGDFEGIIKDAPKDKKEILTLANSLIQKVIRGNYTSDIDEKIILEDGKFVYLRNASSGQQEAIRILQDAFIAINSDNKVLRIIEEPEAHIYPTAQMYLLQLLAMLLNNKEENQIIITTHSPYVLSVINNLMYAYKVGQKNPKKVGEIVNKQSWLAPERVNAYMLTSEKGSERIIDDELCMIKAERIDEVSRTLNEDYDKLLDIEYEK